MSKSSSSNPAGLVMFYSATCPFTKRVEPEVQCLEKAIGNPIVRLEVRSNPKHQEMYQRAAFQRCNGVPYFYNAETGDYICGATSCDRLKEWANYKEE